VSALFDARHACLIYPHRLEEADVGLRPAKGRPAHEHKIAKNVPIRDIYVYGVCRLIFHIAAVRGIAHEGLLNRRAVGHGCTVNTKERAAA
jgi:hypothetical protein